MSMGTWKTKKIKKELAGKRNSTASKIARIYLAYPPTTGWPGGMPEQNGYKRRG